MTMHKQATGYAAVDAPAATEVTHKETYSLSGVTKEETLERIDQLLVEANNIVGQVRQRRGTTATQMANTGRRTGRTYRAHLRCLLAASEGKQVLLIVGSTLLRDHAMWGLRPLAEGYAKRSGPYCLEFNNGGRLRVTTAAANITGHRYGLIIKDGLDGLSFQRHGKVNETISTCVKAPPPSITNEEFKL